MILVIDDSDAAAELICALLQRAGHPTIKALSCELGLEIALRASPDAILCDLRLPAMSGYEFVAIVKADDSLKHIPIIAVTAHALSPDIARAMLAGFDGHIPKPLNTETFARQVEAFL